MSGIPFSSGDCCLPGAEGLTYIKVGPRQHVVGMMNLDMVFKQLFALGRRPDEVGDEEILAIARNFNYIAHNVEAETNYAEALRRAYDAFAAGNSILTSPRSHWDLLETSASKQTEQKRGTT